MSKIDVLRPDQSYEARGIIMQLDVIGHYDEGILQRRPIYRYLSLDCGAGQQSVCVTFVRPADWVETIDGKFIDMRGLKEGDIVVAPGFIYRKIPWSTALMTAHLSALRNYKPKDIISSERSDAPAIDLGVINSDVIQ